MYQNEEEFNTARIKEELSKPAGSRLFGKIICGQGMDNVVNVAIRARDIQIAAPDKEPVAFIHNNRLYIVDDNKRGEQGKLLHPNGKPIDFYAFHGGYAKTPLDRVDFEKDFGGM